MKSFKLHEVINNTSGLYSTFNSTVSYGRSLSTLPRAKLRWLKAYTLVRNTGLLVDEEYDYEKVENKKYTDNGSVPHNVLL